MRQHRTFLAAVAISALLGAGGCSSNTQGDDASPVFLTVNFTLLPLAQNVACNCFLQFDTVEVKNVAKVPGGQTNQFLDVRVDDYIVEWSRVDGGTAASAMELFPGNVVVPAGGSSTLSNYPFMTPSSLIRPPLDQLFPWNGGVDRETGNTIIRQRGKVTFRGHTMSGQTATGWNSFDMNFYYSTAARGVMAVPGGPPASGPHRPAGR